jgi:ketosteroid isomerase-like protein
VVVSTAALSNSELIGAYPDAVMRRDASAVDRYFDPDVEYMVNGSVPRHFPLDLV